MNIHSKYIKPICLFIVLFSSLWTFAKVPTKSSPKELLHDIKRLQVGPVYNSPVMYGDNLYFISSTGSLFTANADLKKVTKIFDLKQNSVSGLLIDGDMAYFGDGLHANELSNFYAYDLKLKKLKYSVKMDGHLEKTPIKWKNTILVSIGPAGLVSLDVDTGKILWSLNKVNKKELHIDSTPLIIDDKVFIGSIYKNKKIISLDPENGKIIWTKDLDMSPKSDLIYFENKIISVSTEGDLTSSERMIPAELVILNTKDGELFFKSKLRGANFFPQLIYNDKLILSLTTGDFLSFNFKNKTITPIDQIAEPFLSSPFIKKNDLCVASVMGRIFCYSKDYKKIDSFNTNEVIIGNINKVEDSFYLPTRIGYLKFK
jgi:outer membrane protein assembly factor BamB